MSRTPILRVLAAVLAFTPLAGCQPASAPEVSQAPGPLLLKSVTLDFSAFNGQEPALEAGEAFRVFGPGASLAQDAEPEYVAVSADSMTAWVTLQENNGLARISLAPTPSVTWVRGLGLQDFGQAGNATDTQDDGQDHVAVHLGLRGYFQPDGLARVTVGGTDYLLLANEGDVREYPGFDEDGSVGNTGAAGVELDPGVFSPSQAAALAGLKVTRFPGSPVAAVNPVKDLYAFGGRSFSVRNAQTGALVWDSGRTLDDAARTNGAYDDGRSNKKSSEPESITSGTVGGRILVFVGLERASSVAVYDFGDPAAPALVQWLSRPTDQAPEGLLFIPAAESPSGRALLVVSNENSGTLSVWQADEAGTFSWASTRDLGAVGAAEITAFDPPTRRLFTVCNDTPSRIAVTELGADLTLTDGGSVPVLGLGAGGNSVAVHGGFVAAAVEGFRKTDPGLVAVWRASTLGLVARAPTGALPDMVAFTPDGRLILTADEGEPSDDYTVDPLGSVTVVDASALY